MTELTRVIIAGGRDYTDYFQMKAFVDRVLDEYDSNIVILCGDARGTDRLGERYARAKGFSVKHYPADWETYGKAAGPIRNRQMAENADVLIAFWDMESRGTASMIEEARRHGLQIYVKNIRKNIQNDNII